MKIIDKSRDFKLYDKNAPIMHGHTKIVLRNVKTGLVEKVESENTFQATYIANYLRNMGFANSSPLVKDTVRANPVWQNVVGGLFLFKDQITAGAEYMSAGNQMVGNGSFGVTNNGQPTELGSYNAIESGATNSAITQVYDFTTAQANGTINSVCLTSALGGYIGYGNKSGMASATTKTFFADKSLANTNPYNTTNSIRHIVGNYGYRFTISGSDMTVEKWKVALTTGSVFDGEKDTITIDISAFHNGVSLYHSVSGGKIYFVPQLLSVAPAGKFYIWEFDPTDDSLTEIEMTNSSSATISMNNRATVSNGAAFIPSSDGVYVFDLSTSALIKVIPIMASEHIVGDLPNGLSLILRQNASDVVYDRTNDTLYPTNGRNLYSGYQTTMSYDSTLNAAVTNDNASDLVMTNPLYLATINNLGSPVTKSAAQTMKVTYTLTAN